LSTLSLSTKPIRRPGSTTPSAPLKSIGGHRVLRRLGAGGMSEVYLVYDEKKHCQLAAKVLPDDLALNDTYVRRFEREAQVGKKIEHPNVVRCFAIGQDEKTNRYYLVMEYVKGRSGQAQLDRFGPMPLAEATQVIIDIARGLEELHHCGFVHRDVKPGNILIGDDGRAKLADLGVAGLIVSATQGLTTIDQGIGTPFYMPWEQSLNAGLVDPRSDLFSLGATYYHLLTGHVPFPGRDVAEVARMKEAGVFKPVRQIDANLPRSVDTLLAKLMAHLPGDRFQTASQLIDALLTSGLTGDKQTPLPMSNTELPPAATRPDLKVAKRSKKKPAGPMWTYQYPYGSGFKRGRARTTNLLHWYAEGMLPADFFIARPGEKTCRHFSTFPEFANLKRRVEPLPPLPKRSPLTTGLLVVGVAVVLTAATSAILNILLGG
jgi:eukaryotic-like serine/threonine-protein kinase